MLAPSERVTLQLRHKSLGVQIFPFLLHLLAYLGSTLEMGLHLLQAFVTAENFKLLKYVCISGTCFILGNLEMLLGPALTFLPLQHVD